MNKDDFLQLLNQRYATKAMNGESVAQEKIERILQAVNLAPTSSGLQPFEIFVVTNQVLKEKIRDISWKQPQVTDCSHLLVFAAWDTYTEERINYMFDLTNDVRGFKNEGWEAYRQQLLKLYPNQDAQDNFQHAAKQTYIAFTAAMIQAAVEGLDATPMEGFDSKKLDELLELNQRGLKSTLMLPIGYRDADNDWLVNLEKVRKPIEKLVTFIN